MRGSGGADAAGVFIQENVTPPVEPVLDAPVVACEGEQGFGCGYWPWQAGNGVDDLVADGDAAGLDTAMAFFDGVGAFTVRGCVSASKVDPSKGVGRLEL